MLWRVLQAHDMSLPDDAVVCFANTGKECEETLEFVRDCSVNWGVPITWLEYRNDETGFAVVDFQTASRSGEPFEALIRKRGYLPNVAARFCSIDLKIRVIHKHLKSLGWDHTEHDDWVGIRADEQRRAAKISRDRVPLVAAGVTKEDVGAFWRAQSFDLKLPNNNGVTMHGNCDICFLKNPAKVLSLISEKPARATWWIQMEQLAKDLGATNTGAVFTLDRPTYASMAKFAAEQRDMFDKNEEAIACFCGD
jgi:3'-phosphoadenosine 5'-phosphosulfate sulfotransferase (PAPS reductase)/FAD synthetase